MYIYIYIYTHTHTHSYTYTYIYTYIHTYIHTYTTIHVQDPCQKWWFSEQKTWKDILLILESCNFNRITAKETLLLDAGREMTYISCITVARGYDAQNT